MHDLLVSIIIPCKDEKADIHGLLKDISSQKVFFDTQIIKITNISPSGHARNTGALKAEGKILIFLDCDIRIGNVFVLSNLIRPLMEDRNVGIVCGSVRIPPDASRFQIRYAKEIPHSESPIVNKLTEVSVGTSACCAIFKEIFFKIGMFNNNITRGVDPEFSFRLKKEGYRVVLSAQTWCYHSMPGNIIELIKAQIKEGKGVAFADTFYPELNIDVDPKGIVYFPGKKSKFERISRFSIQFLEAIFQRKLLLLFVKITYFFSYLYGIFKYRFLSR